MDLASGYSDSINYGNGYTPLATGAINNNNAAYAQQQAAMAAYAQAMQNNVFASGGGFGQQTADYAGAGAAYGRAMGGFGGYGGGNTDPFTPYSPIGNPAGSVQRGPDLPDLSFDPFAQQAAVQQGIWGGGQTPAVDWQKYFTQTVAPQTGGISNQQANPWATSPGYDYNDPKTYALAQSGGLNAPNSPNMQQLLGYDPRGGDGAVATAAGQALMLQNPAEYYRQYGGSSTQTPAPFGGPDTNTYGYPGSGSLGTGTAFGGYQPDTPSGRGGIGSDAVRDQMAWMLAQQSPYAGPGIPSNGPYPNLGYNPGMSNYFANPTMQQYDWTANNAKLQQQMQDALRTIDQSTGRQHEQPYGGALPPFWQGVRDWTGMGAPQPSQGWQEGR